MAAVTRAILAGKVGKRGVQESRIPFLCGLGFHEPHSSGHNTFPYGHSSPYSSVLDSSSIPTCLIGHSDSSAS